MFLFGLVLAAVGPCVVPPVVVTHARTLDGNDREIVIEGGRVTAAGRSGKVRRPVGAEVIDARGDTLLPGLIDGHAHLYELGGPSPREMYTAPRGTSFPITGRQLLRSGVTSARVHLFDNVHGAALKREAEDDCFPAPRLQYGGPGMTGGASELNGAYFTGYRNLEDARAKLRTMREAGADWVALHSLDRFGEGELEAIAAEARRLGLKVMAQGDPAAQAERALAIGANSIEYLDRSAGGGYTSSLVDRLRQSATYVVAPVGYYNRVVEMQRDKRLVNDPRLTEFMPPQIAEGVRTRLLEWAAKPDPMSEAIARVNERFLQLAKAGVKMAAGTDCGSPGNFQIDAMWWELETRRKLGIDAVSAIRSATESGAGLLGTTDIGHLRVGARGDFLIYRGDVGKGPLALDRVRTVGKGGVLYVKDGQWAR